MAAVSLRDVEKELSCLSMEELINLEEKILKVLRRKIKDQKKQDWKKDFLEISTWDHLNNGSDVKLDKWTIETF